MPLKKLPKLFNKSMQHFFFPYKASCAMEFIESWKRVKKLMRVCKRSQVSSVAHKISVQ